MTVHADPLRQECPDDRAPANGAVTGARASEDGLRVAPVPGVVRRVLLIEDDEEDYLLTLDLLRRIGRASCRERV